MERGHFWHLLSDVTSPNAKPSVFLGLLSFPEHSPYCSSTVLSSLSKATLWYRFPSLQTRRLIFPYGNFYLASVSSPTRVKPIPPAVEARSLKSLDPHMIIISSQACFLLGKTRPGWSLDPVEGWGHSGCSGNTCWMNKGSGLGRRGLEWDNTGVPELWALWWHSWPCDWLGEDPSLSGLSHPSMLKSIRLTFSQKEQSQNSQNHPPLHSFLF